MKRTRLIIALVAVVALGYLTLAILHNREPRYQGRTLTEWIDEAADAKERNLEMVEHGHPAGNLSNNPKWQNAKRALNQMAPEAIPWLLKSLQARDSRLKNKVVFWVNTHSWLHLHLKSSAGYNATAVNGLRLLGNDARPAWPALIELT